MRRTVLLVVAVALVLGGAASTILLLGFSYLESPVPGVEVKYYRFPAAQKLRLVVEDPRGRRYPATLDIYVWMPNGSLVDLGRFLGRGCVEVDAQGLVRVLDEWRKHLVEQGDDPGLVKPSILLLGAVHGSDGVYGVFKAVPIDIEKVLRGLSIEVRIYEELSSENLLAPLDRVEGLARSNPGSVASTTTGLFSGMGIEDFCSAACVHGACRYYCFIWRLRESASVLDQGVPLAAAYIHGNASGRANSVTLVERMAGDTSFGVSAAIRGSSGARYAVIGFSMVLRGRDRVWLRCEATFFGSRDFEGDAILALGIKMDLLLARYGLMYCYKRELGAPWRCVDAGAEAVIVAARPVVRGNAVVPWSECDDEPRNGVGVAEKVFSYVGKRWRMRVIDGDRAVYLDTPLITEGAKLAVVVAPLLDGEAVPPAIAGVPVEPVLVICNAPLRASGLRGAWVRTGYFYSPTELSYGGDLYRLAVLYTDVLVAEPR